MFFVHIFEDVNITRVASAGIWATKRFPRGLAGSASGAFRAKEKFAKICTENQLKYYHFWARVAIFDNFCQFSKSFENLLESFAKMLGKFRKF